MLAEQREEAVRQAKLHEEAKVAMYLEMESTLTTLTHEHAMQLQAVRVAASAEKGSVNAALDQQRTATGIVNAITREQIARSPDADAAAAVSRVSGVTVQDGKYVFVRGLGER